MNITFFQQNISFHTSTSTVPLRSATVLVPYQRERKRKEVLLRISDYRTSIYYDLDLYFDYYYGTSTFSSPAVLAIFDTVYLRLPVY